VDDGASDALEGVEMTKECECLKLGIRYPGGEVWCVVRKGDVAGRLDSPYNALTMLE